MNNYVKQICEFVVDEFEGYERLSISQELLLDDVLTVNQKLYKCREYVKETLICCNNIAFRRKDINEEEFLERSERYTLLLEIIEKSIAENKQP